jgi:hypothetical protein
LPKRNCFQPKLAKIGHAAKAANFVLIFLNFMFIKDKFKICRKTSWASGKFCKKGLLLKHKIREGV